MPYKDIEKRRENARKYRENNKDKIKKWGNKSYEKNKEKYKETRKKYIENNKEKIKERQKQWCEKNRDRMVANDKKYRENNRGKIREYRRKYRKTDKYEEYRKGLYKKYIDNLHPLYIINQLTTSTGLDTKTIKQHPELIEMKTIIIKGKRLLKKRKEK